MRLISKCGFTLVMLMAILMVFSSCGSRKNIVYFQPDSTQLNLVYDQFTPTIQPNDILTIVVSASDPKVTVPFNPLSSLGGGSPSQVADMAQRPTYTVDPKGNIHLPMLGTVHIAGLTRLQAIEKLRNDLSVYIKDPGVNMSFNNFKVSVVGEVARPGLFVVPTDRITVVEALSMAGDLTIRGVRENVLLIRETNGQKTMHRLDLTKQETLNSPYYYLAQNDVIYVEPNKTQINNSKVSANMSIIVSVASLLITLYAIISR